MSNRRTHNSRRNLRQHVVMQPQPLPTPAEYAAAVAEVDRRIEANLRALGLHDLADKRAARMAAGAQVIDRYHPKPVAATPLPAEFGPSLKYTLTLREDEGDGKVEHIAVAECDSKAYMVQAVERIGDEAYKHYVTVWDYQWCADGDIVEGTNAQEWLEEQA
jgi:hypothetical protein